MRVDESLSRYSEAPGINERYNRIERKRARLMLRRLRFLEQKVRDEGGLAAPDSNGGAGYVEWEIEALEWALGPEVMDFIVVAHGDDD